MANSTPKPSREERLAAKLRENLHRRKAQARAIDGNHGDFAEFGDPQVNSRAPAGESRAAALPKGGVKS